MQPAAEASLFTCGKDHIPGDQFVVDDGELRQLDARHAGHSSVAAFPVELDIICCVTICKHAHRQQGEVWKSTESAAGRLKLIMYFYLLK